MPEHPTEAADERSADPVDPATKLAFLRRAESYPEDTTAVEVKETHMSWVFLTDRFAYKMKKAVRYDFLDFSSIDRRRHFCEEELRLNRRLAARSYLAVVPLTVAHGKLRLDGSGVPIDWLVKMRRLPSSRMLDESIRAGTLQPPEVRALAELLEGFYRSAPRVPITAADYRQRLLQGVQKNRAELTRYCPATMRLLIDRIADAQARYLLNQATTLDRRVEGGHILEGHGDLRPEHVFLGPPPQIIDCLEFEREFRILDLADDLALLAVECDRLGAFQVGAALSRISATTGASPALIAFYKSYRAAIRAKLAIWHLKDDAVTDHARWVTRTLDYLTLADRETLRFPEEPDLVTDSCDH
jgi:aminoglycoside phosphotransferase family enzyme